MHGTSTNIYPGEHETYVKVVFLQNIYKPSENILYFKRFCCLPTYLFSCAIRSLLLLLFVNRVVHVLNLEIGSQNVTWLQLLI